MTEARLFNIFLAMVVRDQSVLLLCMVTDRRAADPALAHNDAIGETWLSYSSHDVCLY